MTVSIRTFTADERRTDRRYYHTIRRPQAAEKGTRVKQESARNFLPDRAVIYQAALIPPLQPALSLLPFFHYLTLLIFPDYDALFHFPFVFQDPVHHGLEREYLVSGRQCAVSSSLLDRLAPLLYLKITGLASVLQTIAVSLAWLPSGVPSFFLSLFPPRSSVSSQPREQRTGFLRARGRRFLTFHHHPSRCIVRCV